LDAPLKAPVLGRFGTTDNHVTPEMLLEARAALPDMEVHVYEVGHAFANDARPSYVADAAALAHQHAEAFLATHIG
jgi:carboxymethylenebutenolidase